MSQDFICKCCGLSGKASSFKKQANSFDMMGDELICPKCTNGGQVDEVKS